MCITQTFHKLMRLILISSLLPIGLAGCLSTPDDQLVTQDQIKLAGSTTVEPAALAVADAFMAKYPDIKVSVRGGGSTIGVKGIAYGALHIGMTSRPLKEVEIEEYPNLTVTVIGRDGVSVVVNHTLYESGVTQLTLEQVAGIWRGEITNWQEVGGPDLAIIAYDKEFGRGTRDTFANIVLGGEEEPAPGTVGAIGENDAVVTAVSENPGAVSILSTGWQTDDVIGLAIIGKDGQAVMPTNENIASGNYPILRDLNLVTDGLPQGSVKLFIEFMLSVEGQTLVENAGYSRVLP